MIVNPVMTTPTLVKRTVKWKYLMAIQTQDRKVSASGDDEQFEIPNKVPRVPGFKSKDGTVWRQHCSPKAVRTRQCNIVTHLPGVSHVLERLKLLLIVGVLFLMIAY
ncbi:hypothetical protein ANN_09797 [Periplaneta americana]|uniref:Uncharacterized protein n=1 Tax=Periplaneta americana TaxID=6978 RepID=A0ABQ8TM99_PERAM|nr:hypothetical protein ANN_09797 [Periplaneta americana]